MIKTHKGFRLSCLVKQWAGTRAPHATRPDPDQEREKTAKDPVPGIGCAGKGIETVGAPNLLVTGRSELKNPGTKNATASEKERDPRGIPNAGEDQVAGRRGLWKGLDQEAGQDQWKNLQVWWPEHPSLLKSWKVNLTRKPRWWNSWDLGLFQPQKDSMFTAMKNHCTEPSSLCWKGSIVSIWTAKVALTDHWTRLLKCLNEINTCLLVSVFYYFAVSMTRQHLYINLQQKMVTHMKKKQR